jgi:5-methylcytosine-specific restriction endonuclease McrA
VARRFPVLLLELRDGRLHLSGLARLAPLLTATNCEALLARAKHLTTRQVEALVAELAPRPDVPAVVRRLPDRPSLPVTLPAAFALSGDQPVPGRVTPIPPPELVARRVAPTTSRTNVEALAPARYKIQFTASAELRDKLERLAALLRSEVPGSDLAAVIDRAVSQTLQRLEARRFGKTTAARQTASRKTVAPVEAARAPRTVPAAVRRAVYERDDGCCRFVDPEGRRCSERHRLEFHHRHPFAMGGDHSPGNVSLLCGAHNRLLAEHDYGKAAMRQRGKPALRRHESEGRDC